MKKIIIPNTNFKCSRLIFGTGSLLNIFNKKKNIVIPFFVSLIFLLYSLIIGSNKMTEYNYIFSILTLLVFILIFIKYYKYE